MRNVSKLACLLMIAAGSAMAVPQRNDGRADELPQATSQLLSQYPGTHVSWIGGRIATIWGMPMTEGDTPEAAARNFMALHSDAFGVPNIELTLTGSEDAGHGKFKVFVFKQSIGGVDVEFGYASVVVLVDRPDGGRPVVVSVGSRLAQGEVADIPADRVSGDDAVAFARNIREWKHLPVWSKPEMVVFYGEGDLPNLITPIRAWKFVGEQPQFGIGNTRLKHTFFVDAAGTGLKAVRNDVIHADVVGQVQAWATPGSSADHAGNPPVLMTFPWLEVNIGATSANTNATGNFVLANPGTTPVTVSTVLGGLGSGGMWAYINNTNGTGAALTASQLVTPPGPANLVLNVGPSEFTTSQVNTIIAANASHNFIKDRAPTFTRLDSPIATNVNIADSCNAFYDGTSINFFRAQGTCNNTGFSAVAAHEYGHHIVNRHNPGLAQNSFGEGFGDCVSMLMYNDPVLGRYFQVSGGAVRSPDTANIPVPCTGSQAVHNCGQQLSGMWWEIKKGFDIKYGTTVGLQRTQQLFVDWYIITTGGIGTYQAIGETTAAEILTVNDTDGNIGNGTPDYNEVRAAFCAHNVQVPALNLATITPDSLPTFLSPAAGGTPITFTVAPANATVTPGTGRVFYRTAGTSLYFTASTVETTPNHYTATIPTQACGAQTEYYFQVGTSAGNVTLPASTCTASAPTYSASTAYGTTDLINDTFETNTGWTFGVAGDTATTGVWERAVPQATAAQTGSDHTPGAGTMCAVTAAAAGTAVGTNDVDNGFTTLVSPTIDLAGRTSVYVSYWRWFNNNAGNNPNTKSMRVDISNNNGTSWSAFEVVGPTTQNSGGWINKSARLDAAGMPTLTNQMKFRFVPDDTGTGAIVEAALDDFLIYQLDCTSPCAADFNEDGSLDFFDYLDFVDAFSANNGAADFNGDTVIDFFDYLDFVDAFSAGC